jgi:hypothetical protein
VTTRLRDALFRQHETLRPAWEQLENTLRKTSEQIRAEVQRLYATMQQLEELKGRLQGTETSVSLATAETSLASQLAALDERYGLTDDQREELRIYRDVEREVGTTLDRLREARARTAAAVTRPLDEVATSLEAEVGLSEVLVDDLPDPLRGTLRDLLDETRESLEAGAGKIIETQLAAWDASEAAASAELQKLKTTAQPLLDVIASGEAEAQKLTAALSRLDQLKRDREAAEAEETALAARVAEQRGRIASLNDERWQRCTTFADAVSEQSLTVGAVAVSVEIGFPAADRAALADELDGRSRARSSYVDDYDLVDVRRAQHDVLAFIDEGQHLPVRKGADKEGFIQDVVASTPQVLLVGELDGDRIGGLAPTEMSPGKAAQFAFEVLLLGAPEDCPILLDQPEDDLDSDSIVTSVLPRLRELRKDRQILLVTHNANLVVGGDSEQIVVASRTAAGGKYELSFIAGPFERDGSEDHDTPIRRRVCTLLDGGEPAMERRLAQYRLASP